LLTSAAAALIRVRPPSAWDGATLVLRPGNTLDLDALRLQLAERGYHWDKHVDEPGEVALRDHAIDLYPAGNELPVRLDLADAHRVIAIQTFDPFTQRTIATADQALLTPAIEYPLNPDERDSAAAALDAHAWTDLNFSLPDPVLEPALTSVPHQRLIPFMDYAPEIAWWADPEVPDRWAAAAEAIQDAYAAAAVSCLRHSSPSHGRADRPGSGS
jgi:transcription-repair coupling factor (superfamily II helicase)